MIVRINGKDAEVAEKSTLLQIIERRGLAPERIVIERNGEIIRKDRFGEVSVLENDSIEIVNFVCGG
ncbi:sulfur carrier protein ThiS [Candidatus Omnitrophota bacterium]